MKMFLTSLSAKYEDWCPQAKVQIFRLRLSLKSHGPPIHRPPHLTASLVIIIYTGDWAVEIKKISSLNVVFKML